MDNFGVETVGTYSNHYFSDYGCVGSLYCPVCNCETFPFVLEFGGEEPREVSNKMLTLKPNIICRA